MRAHAAAVVLLALAVPAAAPAAESSLARLARKLADEVHRQAGGKTVELGAVADRTGRGAQLALDLHELVRSALQGRVALGASGPRLQVLPVLAEFPARLGVSARLVEQPSGRLQDVIALSVEADAGLLALAARAPAASTGGVDLLSASQTPPLAGPVLDVAFMGPDRLLLLRPEEIALYRWEGAGLSLLSRRPLPGTAEPVRRPGGILRAVEREAAAWAIASSHGPHAGLFAVEGERLVERDRADAMPWPGAAAGLRFRAGTNLIEASVEGLGPGPFLELSEPGAAVDASGLLLLRDSPSELRVGPTLASLWPGALAASSPAPPGGRDTVLVLSRSPSISPRVLAELPVEGAVRALAARPLGTRSARLVAVVESEDPHAGGSGHAARVQTRLMVFDLAAPAARP